MGWFAVTNTSDEGAGPQPFHQAVHEFLQAQYNESAILVLFDVELAKDQAKLAAGKMPIEIYEGAWEGGAPNFGGAGEMDIDGGAGSRQLKFRLLKYEIETGQAERIAMETVARGAGNASAIETGTTTTAKKDSPGEDKDKRPGAAAAKRRAKGKGKSSSSDDAASDDEVLSPEEEEMVVTLTAKANATKMLSSRAALLSAYLKENPPYWLTDTSLVAPENAEDAATTVPIEIIRDIQTLAYRAHILKPANESAFNQQMQQQETDVALVNLLASLTKGVHATKLLGQKHSIFESGKGSASHRRPREALGREYLGGAEGRLPGAAEFFGSGAGGSSGGSFPSPQV
jgi:COP9 signalosome complex subunit 6